MPSIKWSTGRLHFDDCTKKFLHRVLKHCVFFIFLRREIWRRSLTFQGTWLDAQYLCTCTHAILASAIYLSFFNKTATQNINLSCGCNALSSSNIMRKLMWVFLPYFFSYWPPSHNNVFSCFLGTRQHCKVKVMAAQGTTTGKPFVRAFCFSFSFPTNHKNTPLSLMRQKI